MSRMSTAGPLTALLLLVAAATALSDPNTWASRRHLTDPDGVWSMIYWNPAGAYGLDPTGTIFDPSRDQLVLFAHDIVWFQSITPPLQNRYVAIRDWAAIPTAYSAIYDPLRDRIVVLTLDSLLSNVGTFALPLGNPVRWDRLVPFGASPNLSYATAIYDPVGDRMVVYGGVDFSRGHDALGEIWALSLGDRPRWTRIEPHGTNPPPRMEHTAIYDTEHAAMVVYGGRTALQGNALGDAWSLDLAPRPHWRHLAVGGAAPKGRMGHAAIYDAHWRRMIVMGGRPSASLAPEQAYQDLWALSLAGPPQWRPLNPSGESPGPFGRPIAFADASRDRMLLTSYSGSFLWAIDWGDGRRAGADLEEPAGFGNPQSLDPHEMFLKLPSWSWRGEVLMARVSLAQPAGASLGLFDAGGRRIWRSGLNTLAVGEQEVAIAPRAQPPVGVYFLRLEQGGKAQTAKIIRLP